MAKDDAVKQFWAGMFFFVGLVVLAGVVLYLGVRKGLTEPRFKAEVLFDNVGGLTDGSPVRFSGVTVGTVRKMEFLPDEVMGRGVKVTLDIYTKYLVQVRQATRVSILTEGILGARYVEFAREAGEPFLDISHPVLGRTMLDMYDLAEVLQDTADSFNHTTRGIDEIMTEVGYISRKTKRLMDRVEQRVIDGSLLKVF